MAALLVVLALEGWLLGPGGPWPAWGETVEPFGSVYWGVARDRVELQRLRSAPPDALRVAIVGTSRANNGFLREVAEQALPSATWAHLAHPMQDPFAIRSLADEIAEAGADVVVLLLSEMDTHRPVRLEPIPAKAAADFGALFDLMREGGLAFCVRNRVTLYRIALSGLSDAYRFRDIVGRSLLNRLREFPMDERLTPQQALIMRGPAALGRTSPQRLPIARERALLARLPPELRDNAIQFGWFTETVLGAHARVQMALVRGAVKQLREAGIAVLIVECPAHEIADELQQPETRDEFRSLSVDLARDGGVDFVDLESLPRFENEDYEDLFHLNARGAGKLTLAIADALREPSRRTRPYSR